MTKDIITSIIILLLLIAFALWSIAHNITESIVDVSLAIEKMPAEIRRVRESIDGLQKETAKRIVGKSRDGMTLWYQCDTCNEPVDAQDDYCRGCGRRFEDG